jgi:predicted Zn-dependent protease
MGMNDASLDLLQEARRQFPNDFDIGWAVATMLRDAGEIDAALKVAEELVAQFPNNRNVATLRDSLRPR